MKTCPVCDTPYPDQHTNCPTDGSALIESHERMPGHMVRGKYRIVRQLGQGGMGVVYQAEHLMLGGQVALKFLAVELSRNPQFVKRFRNEARAAYQLRHPNIVEVADLDQDEEGQLFIAMEYVAGPSLRKALQETKGPLPVVPALQIACGVASGLAAAHARGAVHRDIKPENILLAVGPAGEIHPKILDFGIAALTDNITGLSRTHGLLLTPEYAAPEQWRGTPANELDGRTDLYALGTVLYEMLTGQKPFQAANPEGWMFQHLQGVPAPLGSLRPDIERDYPGLEAIVMRLLAREREERFPSALAVLEALAPVTPARLTEALTAPSPSVEVQTQRAAIYASSPSAAVPSAVIPSAVLPSAVIPSAVMPSAALPDQPPPTVPLSTIIPRRASPGKWAGLAGLIVVVAAVGAWVGARFLRPVHATAVPVLAPGGGTYPAAEPVTIVDATPRAIIHFTTDGSPPNAESPVYTKPLDALPSGTVVRAMAVAPGHPPSQSVSGAFIWSGGSAPALSGEAIKTAPAHNVTPSAPATTARPAAPQALSSREQERRGEALYNQQRYDEAAPLLEKACDGGNLQDCSYLGSLYQNGWGVHQDAVEARSLYQHACDGGVQPACGMMQNLEQATRQEASRQFEEGQTLYNQKQFQKAKPLFERACDGGGLNGCRLLGALYQNGLGVPQDYTKARLYFQKACDGGNNISCGKLGTFYRDGWGVPQDDLKARMMYQKACDGGVAFACNDLGNLPRQGSRQKQAPARGGVAVAWTDPATGLMWTKKDSGVASQLNWAQAANYCRGLQLDGYSNWRLPTIGELQGIYDPNAESHGRRVKGGLWLSGWQWSSSRTPSGYAFGSAFENQARNQLPVGYGGGRASCVRRAAD